MRATEHTGRKAANGRHPAVRNGADGAAAAVEQLVGHAAALQVRAPELALVLGERAASIAESAGANDLWIRAETLVVQARVKLGHRASTVARAVAALRAAEDAEQLSMAAQLRTDLAVCARSVGAPLTGLAVLRPVLTVGGLSAGQRAAALCHLVGCLGTLGRKAELDRVLMEGDRLVSADETLNADTKLVARAMLRVGISAHRRRYGDLVGAADAARTGLGFLDHLEDRGADGGLARSRLVLELACALLDRGDGELALEIAEPVIAAPERAASVAPVGWLRLAIATRVHLANGSAETAARTLRDAVHNVDRHGLHALTARLWLELANVEERIGQPTEAIQCLYRARASEHLHARTRSQARAALMGEFGSGEQAPVDLAEVVAAAAHTAASKIPQPPAGPSRSQEPRSRHSGTPQAAAETAANRHSDGEQVAAEHTSRQGVSARDEREEPERRRKVVLPMLRMASQAQEADDARSRPAHGPPAPSDPGRQPMRSRTDMEQEQGPDTQRQQPSWSNAQPAVSSRRKRHDSEHGSVAAKSVLDRLGISPGSAGGRRRAADGDGADHPDEVTHAADSDQVSPPARGDASTVEESNQKPPEGSVLSDGYDWLPRLKLPPSLAPLEDFSSDEPADSYSPPEPDRAAAEVVDETRRRDEPEAAHRVPAEEPPPDAGLAELLARALAEHQAGTSSAAALVKRLGVEQGEHGEQGQRSRVNGKHRNE